MKMIPFLKLSTTLMNFALLTFLTTCSYDCDNYVEPDIDKGDYTITTKFDSIRSYPAGGGIFLIKISPDNEFTGKVKLFLDCDAGLNAKLSKTSLKNTDTIAELIISPSDLLDIKDYPIILKAVHSAVEKKINLKVVLYNWMTNSADALIKADDFKSWLLSRDPLYGQIFSNENKIYATYPQTLIVEHYTFLSADYEMRMCYHVMIPPYDWSKIMIRKRNCWVPELAAIRETDGRINVLPVEDYQSLYGY